MRVTDVAAEILERDGSLKVTMNLEDGDRWEHLTKEMTRIAGTTDAVLVDLFWLEPERERNYDLYWQKFPGADKVIVKDGPRKGWVGYFRRIP